MPATSDVLISRVIAARGPAAGTPRTAPASPVVAWCALGVIPATWLRVPGSELRTPAQRFAAFLTDRGHHATLHTAYGLDPAPAAGRLVALVSLGGQRVAVETLAEDRHAAQWARGRETHRLTVTPSGLGEFMQLLLRLDFSENMGVPGNYPLPE